MQRQVYVICYDTSGRVCRKPIAQASLQELRFCDRIAVDKRGNESFLSVKDMNNGERLLNRQFIDCKREWRLNGNLN